MPRVGLGDNYDFWKMHTKPSIVVLEAKCVDKDIEQTACSGLILSKRDLSWKSLISKQLYYVQCALIIPLVRAIVFRFFILSAGYILVVSVCLLEYTL